MMGLSSGGKGALRGGAVPTILGPSQLWHVQMSKVSPALSRLRAASERLSVVCGCPPWRPPSLNTSVCKVELSPDLAAVGSCCLLSLIPAAGWDQASEQGER